MSPSYDDILNLIIEQDVAFIDFRFTDIRGKSYQISIPAKQISQNHLEKGLMFDGSSVSGWQSIEQSDMVIIPDLSTSYIDPFHADKTLVFIANVVTPAGQPYDRDPRDIAKRAEEYLESLGFADTAYFGPEAEFFIFDDVKWSLAPSGCFVKVISSQAPWSQDDDQRFDSGNLGYHPQAKEGYLVAPPIDTLYDIRSEVCNILQELGIPVELHHREVAAIGQCEIGTRFSTLVQRADWCTQLKYVVQRVCAMHGKTATFMPKPIAGDNGSGMHCHISLWKDGRNLFSGNDHIDLSTTALHFIGGIIKHGRALNAIVNPSTNSYKRLVPGFEAPVSLAYSSCNRSVAIRIPFVRSSNEKRIEVRFPDPLCNPYLSFSALLMAGLDGIQQKIHPGEPVDKNVYAHHPDTTNIPTLCSSLEEALAALDHDRVFLTKGGVFSDNFIDTYISLKQAEVNQLRLRPHPVEFELYYTL